MFLVFLGFLVFLVKWFFSRFLFVLVFISFLRVSIFVWFYEGFKGFYQVFKRVLGLGRDVLFANRLFFLEVSFFTF